MRHSVTLLLLAASVAVNACAAQLAQEPVSLAAPLAVYDQAIEARQRGDTRRFLQLSKQLVDWAPMSPPMHFLHAEALALAKQTAASIAELRWLATRGYDYEFWERTTFATLPTNRAVASLRELMVQNGRPAGRIERIVRAQKLDLDAEGIDALARGWIVGSMADGSLYRIERSGATDLLWRESEPARRIFGVRHDSERNAVWACSNGRDDSHAKPELLRISLQTSNVQRARMPDPHSLCNDVALLPAGAVAVSDSQLGQIWKLTADGDWQALVSAGTFAYPNGLTYLAREQRLLVADLRGLWAIDPNTKRVSELAVPAAAFVGGIDGLYVAAADLLAIQNGLRPHRVLRMQLGGEPLRVLRITVLAGNLPELAEMTTAAVVGEELTVLSGAQLVQIATD